MHTDPTTDRLRSGRGSRRTLAGGVLLALLLPLLALAAPASAAPEAAPSAAVVPAERLAAGTVKKQVRRSAKKLVALVNDGKYKAARKHATRKVIRQMKGGITWQILGPCYRSSDDPYDDFEYSGDMPWGCNAYGDIGGNLGMGFKKVKGTFKALDHQWLAD